VLRSIRWPDGGDRNRRPARVPRAGPRAHSGHGPRHHAVRRLVRQPSARDAAAGRARRRRYATPDRPRATTRADRGHPPMGGPVAADVRGRPAGLPDLSWPHAGRRVHHPGLGDRPDPRASPDARRARGARRAAESAIDAGPHEPGRVTCVARRGRRPDRPLSTAPSPRHHAGSFGVGGGPTGAADRSPPASPPPRSPPCSRPARRAREAAGTPPPVGRCARGRRSRRLLDRPQSSFLSSAAPARARAP
jgi:hypothetical protein